MSIFIGALTTVGVYGGLPAYRVLQVQTFRKMRRAWRVPAPIPALPMGVVPLPDDGGRFPAGLQPPAAPA